MVQERTHVELRESGRQVINMLMIRLQRTGKRGQAYFRIVIVEHTKKAKGEFLELLGSYNPHQKEFKVKKDRIEYWISSGAGISPTVNNLMVNYKVWDKPKMQSWKPKVKPKVEATLEVAKSESPKSEEKPEEKPEETTPKTEAAPEA